MARLPFSKVVEKVWLYLLGYYSKKGYMPTLEEIAEEFSTRTHSYTKEWARFCLKELQAQKKIKVLRYKHRGIELI